MSGETKRLNDVPFEDLRVGDKLISMLGKNGVITFLNPNDDDWVEILWENGKRSGGHHPGWGDLVLYVGREV
ncbi:MAG: hypothetical protein HZA35_03465 [Parcubacteria group bacterium]|nr:hypothetical protein [Parcubacteria group bacterium]